MTSIESVPVPATNKIATYFVVPVVPDEGGIEEVRYYAARPDAGKWKPISSRNLNARGQGCSADCIRLHQPSREQILQHTGLHPDKLDPCATLYAGVARTLATDVELLPGTYGLEDGFMTIPVRPDSTRGLILVFSKTVPGEFPHRVVKLIATTDPEIKNGVGTDECTD